MKLTDYSTTVSIYTDYDKTGCARHRETHFLSNFIKNIKNVPLTKCHFIFEKSIYITIKMAINSKYGKFNCTIPDISLVKPYRSVTRYNWYHYNESYEYKAKLRNTSGSKFGIDNKSDFEQILKDVCSTIDRIIADAKV